MNYTTVIFLINKHVRCVVATYEEEVTTKIKRTPFKTFDKDIQIGDFVVVPTNTRHGMTVCKIVECDVDVDFDATEPMAWIVRKIDRSEYDRVLAEEADAVQKIRSAEAQKKRGELRDALLAYGADTIKALPIVDMNGNSTQPPAPKRDYRGGF